MFRRGQWVVFEGKVGIHLGPKSDDPSGLSEVHLVDEAGLTVGEILVEPVALRSARISEIPEPRRKTADQGFLAARYEA